MGLFSHDDENKQPQDQAPAGTPDDGQVPTDAGVTGGGADDLQGAMPTQQPPADQPPVDNELPGGTPPEGGDTSGDVDGQTGVGDDNQVPPAAPQQ